MEADYDGIYVGNESEKVTERISREDDDYYYYYEEDPYEHWTDLNGNTLVIVVQTDEVEARGGFELEFKCRDQFSIDQFPTCSQLMVHLN